MQLQDSARLLRAVFPNYPELRPCNPVPGLEAAPVYPQGFDPKVVKVWFPNFEEYVKLHGPWVEEWNKTYGYRQ